MTPRGCPSFVTFAALVAIVAVAYPWALAVGSLVLTVIVGTRSRA